MDNLEAKVQLLEERTASIERHLKRWRFLAFMLGIAMVMTYAIRMQRPPEAHAQAPSRFSAPFEIYTQSNGKTITLLKVEAFTTGGLVGSGLTLYSNGQPAAQLVTSGALYKDAEDPSQNYLNLLETFLYKYPPRAEAKRLLVSSLALTRAGGSVILWNNTDSPGVQPTHAARLTAKRGVGGTLILSSEQGVEASRLPAPKQ